MANFFDTLFGKSPGLQTTTVTTPTEQAVATPLSSYLAGNIGRGLPSYGGPLTAPLANNGGAGVSNFLSQTPDQLFAPVRSAAETSFKTNVPDILEKYAGGLSSSAAGAGVGNAFTQLEEGLASQQASYESQIPQEQLNMALQLGNYQTQADQAEYQNWWNSLAQNNPAIAQAMQFLQTGGGSTVIGGMNPGQQGILGSIIGAAGQIGAAVAGA